VSPLAKQSLKEQSRRARRSEKKLAEADMIIANDRLKKAQEAAAADPAPATADLSPAAADPPPVLTTT